MKASNGIPDGISALGGAVASFASDVSVADGGTTPGGTGTPAPASDPITLPILMRGIVKVLIKLSIKSVDYIQILHIWIRHQVRGHLHERWII